MLSPEEDDVFQGNEPPVVDCDVLEAAKENVQPLGTGRRVTALSAILATPHAQRETKLAVTRNRLRINVEISLDDEDGDALDAYWQFVNWTLDNYPQGHSAESGLLELLEEATRVLKDHNEGKWRGDIKYLKLWLLYASYVEKPVIIYKFLTVNEIGAEFALLYEEYAAVLERDGRRKEADEAYCLGIARKASPLEHLQERYNDFQKRMMSNMMLPPPTTTASSLKSRTALTTTSLKPSTSRSQASSRSVSNPVQNGKLQIFVDPSGADSQAAQAADSWEELGTRKTRIKENVPEVKKMAGAKLKQAGRSKRIASSSAASSSKIAVYCDPGPEEMPPPPAISKPKTKASIPIPKTPAKSSFMPFVYGEDTPSNTLPPVTPRFTPFKDETATLVSPANPVTESVIKVKKAGLQTPMPSSEVEALRKDPLKNYPDVRIVDDG